MPHPGTNARGFEVTVQAPINIALIKYWGKRNEVGSLWMAGWIQISLIQNEIKAIQAKSVSFNGNQCRLGQVRLIQGEIRALCDQTKLTQREKGPSKGQIQLN
jgi:hypothetical protein